MIRGEESTGRQVAARAIHETQTPANGAFVPLDCAAYDGDQLDMALFGVSARASGDDPGGRGLERVGSRSLLYEAQHGTLYLQHIVDAPSRVQARLARVLRDREAHLVDSGTTIALDVRPMAGADTTLECAVQEGHMRGDLFKRLSATQIDMPALRNRRDDIPALANHFVREICGSLRMPPKALSRPALTLLAALPWHGNADELRGLLQNIVTALPEGRGVGLEDVLAHVQLDGGPAYGVGGTLRQARAQFERDYITGVVVRHQGRISEAARVLGIQRTNLYRKMRLLKVSRDDRLSSYPPRAFPPGRQNS
jgi:two-component system nitrogen regulation response regulator NtrX